MSFQKSLFIPLVAFLIMTIFLGFGFQLENAKILPSALIDKPLPNFQLRDLESGEILRSASDLVGEVALVNVWGTWCPNCVVEDPELLKISREQNIKIFGVNYRDNDLEAKKWLKKYNAYDFLLQDVKQIFSYYWDGHEGSEINKNKLEYIKYFKFIPASHNTIIPLKAIKIEVPKSG